MTEFRDQLKKQLEEELALLARLSHEKKNELKTILESEKLEKRYVYVIWSTCTNRSHNSVSSSIDAAYDSREEAEANLPSCYRSGNREVTFRLEKVLVGHKKENDIRSGYYSD